MNFRTFAIQAHGDQRYGIYPYAYHLASVEFELVELLKLDPKFTHFAFEDVEFYRATAWLHDVLEDTNVTFDQLKIVFDRNIAEIVWAVTGIGENRKARLDSIRSKIQAEPEAAVLKLADRISNIKMSLQTGSNQLSMYRKEHSSFVNVVKDYVLPLQLARLEILVT